LSTKLLSGRRLDCNSTLQSLEKYILQLVAHDVLTHTTPFAISRSSVVEIEIDKNIVDIDINDNPIEGDSRKEKRAYSARIDLSYRPFNELFL